MNGDDYEHSEAEMELLVLDAARWRFIRRIACASEEEQERVLHKR